MTYQKLFERLYSLIGREYSLVIAVDDNEFATTNYRPLLKEARSVSFESGGSHKIIKGTVTSFDFPPLNLDTIKRAFDQKVGAPLILAIVTESNFDLNDLNKCPEIEGFKDFITGGYVILSSFQKTPPTFSLCQKQPMAAKKKGTTKVKEEILDPKFLVGMESNVSFAIRISQDKNLKVIDIPRSSQQWETHIQNTVEREISKLLVNDGINTLELGDGLTMRMWPELARQISLDSCWHSVFTHQSVNPTVHGNYESKETLGDSVLSLVLIHYLLSTDSKCDSNSITDIRKVLLADDRQTEMATVMGFSEPGLIRSSVGVDNKMLEDVLEAFFGCLFTVSNRLSVNSGLGICEALFRRILEERSPGLNVWSIGKDSPTVLDQLFKKLQWGDPVFQYDEEKRVTSIFLTKDAVSFLQTIGPAFKGDVPLAVGKPCADQKSSKKDAATLALEVLKIVWGIDTRYTNLQVRARLLTNEKYASVHRDALKTAKKLGFSDIYVARRAKHNNQLYIVMGIRPTGEEEQLCVYKYEKPTTVQEQQDLSTRVIAYITALKRFILQCSHTENS